jgi:hypothetical protein
VYVVLGSLIRPNGIRCADHATPSIGKKVALTSTSGGRSVGIVRSRTKAMEFVWFFF